SGTAVANLHPAVLEAKHSRVRLLVISADRPEALRGTGANQTTNQVRIFGDIAYAGLASGAEPGAEIVELLIAAGAGPAQLNLEFGEPLIANARRCGNHSRRGVDEKTAISVPPGDAVVLAPGKRTVVVAGDNAGPPARILAEAGNWPLFAEPSSGARTGLNPIAAYRLVLQNSPLAEQIERVIVFGHPTLSRPIGALLAREELETIVIGGDLSGFPNGGEHTQLHAAAEVSARDDPDWLDAWREHGKRAIEEIAKVIDTIDLTGYSIARKVAAAIPPRGLLYVGSSNSIRDLDLVAAPFTVGERRLTLANRGLAGIDGTLSSAIGAALARPSARAIAYVGDLTFLHDINGLLIGPGEPRPDLTVVVASDDGGSIFATLEQGAPEYAELFERVFATPTGADISGLCHALGIPHIAVNTSVALEAALAEKPTGIRVIEARIGRGDRRAFAARLSDAVRAALT
ncbi:MAG TPA: thiamine pyrophosphate-dependent enzyme, partial [Aeromicrobium sp.]|nr:thiamine pyrophosphate-dependent enzyme [Aeromicrobium sp.]